MSFHTDSRIKKFFLFHVSDVAASNRLRRLDPH